MANKAKKGSAFEREICRILSEWWTNGERDDVFWRTSNSGGRATTRAKQGKETANQYGDICAVDPIGLPFTNLFMIELKRGYGKYSPFDWLDQKKGVALYEKWISKLRKQASSIGQFWLLIVKRDGREPFVIMEYATCCDFCLRHYSPKKAILFQTPGSVANLYIVSLKEFLKYVVSPKQIAEYDGGKEHADRS